MLSDLPAAGISGEQEALRRDLLETASRLIAGLSPADAEVLLASFFDAGGRPARLSPAAWRKRLERAVARLRIAWRDRHGRP